LFIVQAKGENDREKYYDIKNIYITDPSEKVILEAIEDIAVYQMAPLSIIKKIN
jgi:hypothetical protein